MGARHPVEVWGGLLAMSAVRSIRCQAPCGGVCGGASKWRAAGGTRGQALRAGWLKLMHAGTDAAQAG